MLFESRFALNAGKTTKESPSPPECKRLPQTPPQVIVYKKKMCTVYFLNLFPYYPKILNKIFKFMNPLKLLFYDLMFFMTTCELSSWLKKWWLYTANLTRICFENSAKFTAKQIYDTLTLRPGATVAKIRKCAYIRVNEQPACVRPSFRSITLNSRNLTILRISELKVSWFCDRGENRPFSFYTALIMEIRFNKHTIFWPS